MNHRVRSWFQLQEFGCQKAKEVVHKAKKSKSLGLNKERFQVVYNKGGVVLFDVKRFLGYRLNKVQSNYLRLFRAVKRGSRSSADPIQRKLSM